MTSEELKVIEQAYHILDMHTDHVKDKNSKFLARLNAAYESVADLLRYTDMHPDVITKTQAK